MWLCGNDLWERFLEKRRWVVFQQVPTWSVGRRVVSALRGLSRKGEKSFFLVLDALFQNLGQSRRGQFKQVPPMLSMTVILFAVELRHFRTILDREGSSDFLMTAHVFSQPWCVSPEDL